MEVDTQEEVEDTKGVEEAVVEGTREVEAVVVTKADGVEEEEDVIKNMKIKKTLLKNNHINRFIVAHENIFSKPFFHINLN